MPGRSSCSIQLLYSHDQIRAKWGRIPCRGREGPTTHIAKGSALLSARLRYNRGVMIRLQKPLVIVGFLCVVVAVGLVLMALMARAIRPPLPSPTPIPPLPILSPVPMDDSLPRLERCAPAQINAAFEALPTYVPGQGSFVEVSEREFEADGVGFVVRGVNYYPMYSPWRRFVGETTSETLQTEFGIMRRAGLNTLRIFIWYEAFFHCPGSGVVPNPDAFLWLDGFIRQASDAGFRLIVTLNDLPDLERYPLYNAPAHTQAQTRFIVARYRDEPAIMAWDLRNEGDIDYRERFERAEVLGWLADTSALVRDIDPKHLITAGWQQGAASTDPYVDFLSFHHWSSAAALRDRIRALETLSAKPLLLEELGYSTLGRSESAQAALLDAAISTAEAQGLAGWLVWTAFDFPRTATCWPDDCLSPDNQEHYFGLWRIGYIPKPAVDVVLRYTNVH